MLRSELRDVNRQPVKELESRLPLDLRGSGAEGGPGLAHRFIVVGHFDGDHAR